MRRSSPPGDPRANSQLSTYDRVSGTHTLRALGIRTATDLKLAWGEEDPEESSYAPMVRHQLVEAVGGNKTGIARIEIVLQSLENDASFLHVQAFRRHDWLQNVVK